MRNLSKKIVIILIIGYFLCMNNILYFRSVSKLFLFCVFLAFLSFFSCSTRINGSISADGSADLSLNVSLGPRMANLIRAVTTAGGRIDGPVLDGPAISRSMSDAPGIASVSLRNTNPSAIEGTVKVSKISEFLSAGYNRSFITFDQGNAGGRCEITVNRANGQTILEMLSPEISDYLHALMAPIATGETLSKSEYLDLVASFYNKAISDEIAGSRLRASVDFPGNITAVRGGTYSGKRAEFDIPLVDLLVPNTPVSLEVRWR